MIAKLKNPEFRQPLLRKSMINCRPSGLSDSIGEIQSLTRKKTKTFNIRVITDIKYNGVIESWNVLSSGKRSVLVRYLFLKFIYDELSKQEYFLWLSFQETTSSVQMYFAIKARLQNVPKKLIRKILENVSFEKTKQISRQEYISLKPIKFSFEKKTYPPIEKPKPYTGYSKGYKDGKRRGSKFQVDEFSSSPLEPSPNFEEEVNTLINFSTLVKSEPRKFNNFVFHLKEFIQ